MKFSKRNSTFFAIVIFTILEILGPRFGNIRIYEFEKGVSIDDLTPKSPNDASDDENERKGGLNKEAIEKWLNDVNVYLPNGNQSHGFETKLGMVTNGYHL